MLVGSTSSLIVHFSHLEGVSASEELKDVVVCILMGKHSPAPRLPLTACFCWKDYVTCFDKNRKEKIDCFFDLLVINCDIRTACCDHA